MTQQASSTVVAQPTGHEYLNRLKGYVDEEDGGERTSCLLRLVERDLETLTPLNTSVAGLAMHDLWVAANVFASYRQVNRAHALELREEVKRCRVSIATAIAAIHGLTVESEASERWPLNVALRTGHGNLFSSSDGFVVSLPGQQEALKGHWSLQNAVLDGKPQSDAKLLFVDPPKGGESKELYYSIEGDTDPRKAVPVTGLPVATLVALEAALFAVHAQPAGGPLLGHIYSALQRVREAPGNSTPVPYGMETPLITLRARDGGRPVGTASSSLRT